MKFKCFLLITALISSKSNTMLKQDFSTSKTMDKPIKLDSNKKSSSEPHMKGMTDRSVTLSHSIIDTKSNSLPKKKSHSLPNFEFTFKKI